VTRKETVCACDDTDLDAVYRKCCILVGNVQYITYYAFFDSGAHHFSFVNRKVAAWIIAWRGDELKPKDVRCFT